jgi:murein DD-endopeptidase MepM/ murein hydrolase activator NlpD
MKSVKKQDTGSYCRRSIANIVLTLALLFVAGAAVAAPVGAGRRDAGGVALSSAVGRDAAPVDAFAVRNAAAAADSAAEAQLRDEEGQDFNSLFDDMSDDDIMAVDTSFAWSNSRINSGRFNYNALGENDTIKIALVDSAQNKFFTPPFVNRITSPFGKRRFLWHYGMDLKLVKGDTVRNAFDGIVRVIQYDRRGFGNVVVVRHHNGLETVYGHLFKVLVKPNQHVKSSETVGLGGNTGRSTGAHLHFEIRYYGEPIDPRYVIDYDTHKLWSDTLVLTKNNFDYLTELRKTVYHTVRKGEGIGSIARRYRTTVKSICKLNAITPKTILSVGRRLIVKGAKEVGVLEKFGIPPTETGTVTPGVDGNRDEAMNKTDDVKALD